MAHPSVGTSSQDEEDDGDYVEEEEEDEEDEEEDGGLSFVGLKGSSTWWKSSVFILKTDQFDSCGFFRHKHGHVT